MGLIRISLGNKRVTLCGILETKVFSLGLKTEVLRD